MCMMINSVLHCGLWLLFFFRVYTLADLIIIVLETTCTLWVGFFQFQNENFIIVVMLVYCLATMHDPGAPTVNNRTPYIRKFMRREWFANKMYV